MKERILNIWTKFKERLPQFHPGAWKAYLQFFAGIVCLFIGLTSESISGAVGSFTGAYLFLREAFS